ncbi:MAG: UvrD-helicase domain-containing protein [Firmicutes bacterium]|nr:UvrD-helicase domain-containing protein [Bacillota bacterium]
MKASNLQFKSNLYVLNADGKSSKEFMKQVSDAKTLLHIHRRSSGILLDWQRKFADQGMSCALAKRVRDDTVEIIDRHTHGIVTENGKKICVCKCQHKECSRYSICSSHPYFREVTLEYEPDAPPPRTVVDTGRIDFGYFGDSPVKPPEVVKITPFIPTAPQHEDNSWHSYKGWKEEHSVRGHERRLPDGTTTWVRGHTRGGGFSGGWEHPDNIIGGTVKPQPNVEPVVEPEYDDTIEFEDGEVTPDYTLKNLVKIDSADGIITAAIEERILVNGGAGTGKTHTVIERLKYILKHALTKPDEILVLCFSRAAVKVIRKRLKDEILAGGLDYDAEQIDIRTFDSFATYYLKEADQNINLQYADYDERIRRFIRRFTQHPEEIDDNLSYLVVDEIQDLVGDRAEMVKCLLDKISCGFLLLGDQCQAIYDYQVDDDQLNAAKFFAWLDDRFGKELKQYELTKNYRQKTAIQTEIVPLRQAMLSDGIKGQKRELQRIIKKFSVGNMTIDEMIECCSGERAILSWSNGDAYSISQDLYTAKNAVEHLLLGNSRKTAYTKELAYILSTYPEKDISQRTFLQLAQENGVEDKEARRLWNALHKLDPRKQGFVELAEVRKQMLWEGGAAEELINTNDSTVTISTIHKAKGKEYDEVLIKLSKIKPKAGKNDTAEIKVYYVALTRAKSGIVVKIESSTYDEKTKTGRFLRCKNRVTKYELGLDGDIDMLSFVDKRLFGSDAAVRANQDYIRYKVKRGDSLTVWLEDGIYKIFHHDRVIGSMNHAAFETHWSYVSWFKKSIPHYLTDYNRFVDIYVSDVITVVNRGVHASTAEPYSKSGFWLGVDFCGYSRPMEE